MEDTTEYVPEQAHVDQLYALSMVLDAVQAQLASVHPTERRRYLKDPRNILSLVFTGYATHLAGGHDEAKALLKHLMGKQHDAQ